MNTLAVRQPSADVIILSATFRQPRLLRDLNWAVQMSLALTTGI